MRDPSAIGFGLQVESFGWGIVGAFVLAVFAWLIGLVVRPALNRPRAERDRYAMMWA